MLSKWWWSSGAEANDSGVEIANSLRFRGDQSLHRSFSGTSNTYTFSFWVKISTSDADLAYLFSAGGNSPSLLKGQVTASGKLYNPTLSDTVTTGEKRFRDPSAWYHVMLVSNAGTESIYINGELCSTPNTGSGNYNGQFVIGRNTDLGYNGAQLQGYMAQWYGIDGQALEPTAFGRELTTGQWVPREVDFTPAQTRNSDNLFTAPSSNTIPTTGTNRDFFNTRPATRAFDGDLTTDAVGDEGAGSWMMWFPTQDIEADSTLRVRTAVVQTIAVNGTDTTLNQTGTGAAWVNLTPQLTFPLDLDAIQLRGTGASNPTLNAIEVDGEVILNPFIWSADLTCPSGFDANGPGRAFNGDTGNQAAALLGGSTNPLTFAPRTEISYNRLEVHCTANGMNIAIGDTTVVSNGGWREVENAAGTISATRSLTITPTTTATAVLSAIRVNGNQILVDGVNNSYGAHGFHLDFSDPDDIGADRSGNGNDFTPSGGFNLEDGNVRTELFREGFRNFNAAINTTDSLGFTPFTPADQLTITSGQMLLFRMATSVTEIDVVWNDDSPNISAGGTTWAVSPDGTASSWTTVLSNASVTGRVPISNSGAQFRFIRAGAATDWGWGSGVLQPSDQRSTDFDHMTDSPTQNFATGNPLVMNGATGVNVLTNANLGKSAGSSAIFNGLVPTIYWDANDHVYFELHVSNFPSQTSFGFTTDPGPNYNAFGTNATESTGVAQWLGTGFTLNSINTDGGTLDNLTFDNNPTMSANSVWGWEWDGPNRRIRWYLNGTLGGTSSQWGVNTFDRVSFNFDFNASPTSAWTINYGQQPYLNIPTGLTQATAAIQTQNLPAATIRDGREHFRAITGAGTGSGATPGANQTAGNFSKDVYGNNNSTYDPNTTDKIFLNESQNFGPINMFNGVLNNSDWPNICKSGTGSAQTWIYWRPDPAITGVTSLSINCSNTQTVRINGGAATGQSNTAIGNIDIASPPATITSIAIQGNTISSATIGGIIINGNTLVDFSILQQAQNTFGNGLYWIKDRDNEVAMQVVDTVRGVDRQSLCSSSTNSTESAYAAPAGNCVAWCWNAPDAFTNAAGTNGATIASTGRVNRNAGFSIVSYTGNASNNSSVAHGLAEAPEMVIYRVRGDNSNWVVYGTDFGIEPPSGTVLRHLRLNTADSFSTATGTFAENQTTTNTLLRFGDNTSVNSSNPMVAYCWHSVPGYSAIGMYQGNSNTNGPFIWTGFRPAFVLWKQTSGGGFWGIMDTTRNPNNPLTAGLYPNTNQTELTDQPRDFLSNGFKIRESTGWSNRGTIFYAAFAENPFGGSNTSPANAR